MKGLEALKALKDMYIVSDKELYIEPYNVIEKELKALDIIIEKRVQISWFTSLLKYFPHYTHEDYNFALPDNMQLMKEEYEILKRYFHAR